MPQIVFLKDYSTNITEFILVETSRVAVNRDRFVKIVR